MPYIALYRIALHYGMRAYTGDVRLCDIPETIATIAEIKQLADSNLLMLTGSAQFDYLEITSSGTQAIRDYISNL